MAEIFTNNATSTLAASMTTSATSATVQTGEGAKYPNPSSPDFFRVALFKKSTGELELGTCAARSGDILTLVRAQEGTTALALSAGDVIELRPTAAFFNSLSVTSANIQDNSFKYDVESGVSNAYVITPNPAISAYGVGQEFWFKPLATGTGAATLSVSGVATPPAIKLINGANPYAGALTAGRMAHVIHDGTNYVLQNPHEQSFYFPNVAAATTATNAEMSRLSDAGIPYNLTDSNGNDVIKRGTTASAVNEVTVTNAATGNGPTVEPTGTDTNIDLNLKSKGAGNVVIAGENFTGKFTGFIAELTSILTTPSAGTIIFDSTLTDTDSWYDSTTGLYTPLWAGWYLVSVDLILSSKSTSLLSMIAAIRKNGATNKTIFANQVGTAAGNIPGIAVTPIYMNGSTDNINVNLNIALLSSDIYGGAGNSRFSAHRIGG